MNELEKSKLYICDRNNRLTETSKRLNIPLPTLNMYRHNPDKLRTAAWERVHKLAKLYDEKKQKGKA